MQTMAWWMAWPLVMGALQGQDSGIRIRLGTVATRIRLDVDAAAAMRTARQISQEQGEQALKLVRLHGPKREEQGAILGTYRIDNNKLVFEPRYPLAAGETYRAIHVGTDGKRLTLDYTVPKPEAGPPAVVERIYPSGDELPANLVKFYIHFSKPMRETSDIFDHIELRDASGKAIHDPWRRSELWTNDFKRLTLWVHPGRVKEGVNLRDDIGPVMEPEQKYSLVILRGVIDGDGQALGKEFVKEFRTTQPDRVRPLPEKWTLRAPERGTREPLIVEFPKLMDRHLLDRLIFLTDDAGKPVAGKKEAGPEERSWKFTPETAWRDMEYALQVGEEIEDVAGNTPIRIFETDLRLRKLDAPVLLRTFRPK